MNRDLDELMRDFARVQLGGQRGALAAGFKPAPRRGGWRLRIVPLGIAAAFLLTAGLTIMNYPQERAERPTALASAAGDASESVTDEVWYRDVPGQTVLLEDNTPAQVVYWQIYQIRTTETDGGKEVSTETIPTNIVALVSQPVY